jgi:hypothetical protein
MSTTQSDTQLDNATTNVLHDEEEQRDHLIEAYLVVEDEEHSIYDAEEIPIYDATPELPWWRQRRFKILVFVLCISLISLMAAFLAVFLGVTPFGVDASAVTTPEPTTSLSPSSSPHTSPKVSLIIVSNGTSLRFFIQVLSNLMPEFPGLLSEQE